MPALRITAHARGGLSVYGPGYYDAKRNEAVALTREDETLKVVIEHASAATSPAKETSGVTSSTPTVSNNQVSLTLSALQDNGYADITATVGGATSKVRIRAKTETTTDTYAS